MAKDGKDTVNRVAATESEPGSGSFVVSNRHVTFVLLMATAVLVLANLATQIVAIETGRGKAFAVLFDLGRETSVATWFAEMLLLFLAALLFVAAAHARSQDLRDARYWFGTAVVAVYMSIDEGSALHEKMSHGTRTLLDIHVAFLEYAWVIPFTALAIGLVAVLFKFWRRLPDRPRRFLALGALLFVFGAVSFELVQGEIVDNPGVWGGRHGYVFLATVTIEETLEFVGVILAAYGVLEYLRLMLGDASTSVHLES